LATAFAAGLTTSLLAAAPATAASIAATSSIYVFESAPYP
jgi:hypothetical protein